MGLGMAKNLQIHATNTHAPPISYTNRTMARGDPLKATGAIPRSSVKELVQNSDIIFTSVSDDDVLLAIVDTFTGSGDVKGKILVDTSTVHPNTATEVSGTITNSEATFVAAPVFGASPAAAAGTVLFAVAGPEAAVTRVQPFLEVMSRKVLRLPSGAEPSQALLLKTTSNFLMAGLMELVAEAHVFAEKTGLSGEVLEKLLEENFGSLIHTDSMRMTTGVYAGGKPWSDADLAIKDVGHGVDIAEQSGCKLPVGELALANLKKAQDWGMKNARKLDSTSRYGVVREDAELDFETDVVKRLCRD